jgi:LuxR family maltose regulon positive regulatory protein
LHALSQWSHLRLIQITAPAGYGKTSLTTLWLHHLGMLPPAERPALAWISTPPHVDADHWLQLWIEALVPLLPDLRDLQNYDGKQGDASHRVRTLCREIATSTAPIVLVVDDYHLVQNPAAHAVTQQVLDAAIPLLHLVLLSRTPPPLQLTQLILDDALLELTQQDLQFDHDEFVSFTREHGLDRLPDAVLAQFEQHASGWITGLKLLSYGWKHNPAALSESAHSTLDHFFESQVLAALPAQLRRVVEVTAPLPYLDAELLAAAIDQPPDACAELLRMLAAADAFVTVFSTPDGKSSSYRFHPLFSNFLCRRINPRAADVTAVLHRAAVWLCDHDEVDAALDVLKLDDGRQTADGGRRTAIDALAAALRRALLRYDRASAGRWLAALPIEQIAAHAPLAVAAGWHAWICGIEDIDEILTRFQRAADAVDALPHEPRFDELRAEASVLQAIRCFITNDHAGCSHFIDAAERTLRGSDGLASAYMYMLRAAFIDVDGSVDSRLQLMQSAVEICERIGFGHGAIEMMFTQMLLKWRCCLFESADATAAYLLATIALEGWRFSSYVTDIHYFRGEMHYLTGRVAEARVHLRLAAEHSRPDGPYVYMSQVMLQLCDLAESDAPLDYDYDFDADAKSWVEIVRNESIFTKAMAAWPRLLRDFRAGRPQTCRQTLELLRVAPADVTDQMPDRLRLAVLAGAIFEGRTDEAITAKLAELRAFLESANFTLVRLQVQMLQALHAHQRGDAESARRFLDELLPDIERTGMIRLLLDFAPLHDLVRTSLTPVAQRLSAHLPRIIAPPPTPCIPDYALTRREQRILAALADDRDPKEIAAEYNVSVATVRVHISNIYRKLGAHSREEAVRVWKRSESREETEKRKEE